MPSNSSQYTVQHLTSEFCSSVVTCYVHMPFGKKFPSPPPLPPPSKKLLKCCSFLFLFALMCFPSAPCTHIHVKLESECVGGCSVVYLMKAHIHLTACLGGFLVVQNVFYHSLTKHVYVPLEKKFPSPPPLPPPSKKLLKCCSFFFLFAPIRSSSVSCTKYHAREDILGRS